MTFLRILQPYLFTAIITVAILYLTLWPQPLGPEPIPMFFGADKIAHFIMFGSLTGAFLFDRWRRRVVTVMSLALTAALASSMLGIVVEVLQSVMALGRSGNDPGDALANVIGSFMAIPVCSWLGWIARRG